jgi:hypothetical protein
MGIISNFFTKRRLDSFRKKAEKDLKFRFQINVFKEDNTPILQVLPQNAFKNDFEIKDENGYAILVLVGNIPIRNKQFEQSRFYLDSNNIDVGGKKYVVFVDNGFKELGEVIKELLEVVFDIDEEEYYKTDLIEL